MSTEKLYVLFYDAAPDYLERRAGYRDEHLQKVFDAIEKGEMVMGGAFSDPANQAMLIFRSREAAEQFANTDPYVINKVATHWHIRTWNVVHKD